MNAPTQIIQEAMNAFWASIASNYPQIKSGDIDVQESLKLAEAMDKAVSVWLEDNTVECDIPGIKDLVKRYDAIKNNIEFNSELDSIFNDLDKLK